MGKVSLKQVRLNQGGYEYGKYGQYYGTGQSLYRADFGDYETIPLNWNDSLPAGDVCEFQAYDRESAKAYLLNKFPGIKFYR